MYFIDPGDFKEIVKSFLIIKPLFRSIEWSFQLLCLLKILDQELRL